MCDPTFSESQLQQAINTAFIRKVFERTGEWIFVNVPSLHYEFDLGWDSAFYLPWLPFLPLTNNEGSNLFIQYKLSKLLSTRGAGEWGAWKEEYYRFKIPHSTRDKIAKVYFDDYHQWERLKELALLGYPTYYATNSTLNKNIIIDKSKKGILLDSIPMLDVSDVMNKHKFVTFTEKSSYFQLHSEIEKIKKYNFLSITEQSFECVPMEYANKNLLSTFKTINKNDEIFNIDLNKILELNNRDHNIPTEFRSYFVHNLLAGFVHKHLGAELFWLPSKG